MNLYIFGYGSLMNPKSLEKTLPGERAVLSGTLMGYQRKINAPVNGYLYMNLVPNPKMTVRGVVVQVTSLELAQLKLREPGYECVEITKSMEKKPNGAVLTFIAPDKSYPKLKVPRSYLLTCLMGVKEEKEKWLQETMIQNEIEEDVQNPVYINAIFDKT